MKLPPKVSKLIYKTLEELRKDPEVQLRPYQRLEIYQAFDSEGEMLSRRTVGYLQIITAEHVQEIWMSKLSEWHYYLHRLMLPLTEDILEGRVDPNSRIVKEIIDYRYHTLGGMEDDDDEVVCATYALDAALSMVRGSSPFKNPGADLTLTDDELYEEWEGDAASQAVKAYSGFYQVDMGEKSAGKSDPAKRLQFWEWWLNEAISQAWHKASNQP